MCGHVALPDVLFPVGGDRCSAVERVIAELVIAERNRGLPGFFGHFRFAAGNEEGGGAEEAEQGDFHGCVSNLIARRVACRVCRVLNSCRSHSQTVGPERCDEFLVPFVVVVVRLKLEFTRRGDVYGEVVDEEGRPWIESV